MILHTKKGGGRDMYEIVSAKPLRRGVRSRLKGSGKLCALKCSMEHSEAFLDA